MRLNKTYAIVLLLPAAALAGLYAFGQPACEREAGLADRDDVIFSCSFECPLWYQEWGLKEAPRTADTVAKDPTLKFEPYRGKALRARIEKGGNLALNLLFPFKKRLGAEPEEIYFRYYLRFADDWLPEELGGKLPGISGTYGRAGWGGRKVNGRDGWSARGSFSGLVNGKTPVGFYCYHADMKGRYGDVWVWDKDNLGYLANNRWYCIEQHVKMNTPGRNDGVMQAWIDGKPAFEKTDVRMRDVDDLKIENIWLNVYQGGTKPARAEHHLYIDNVVIARNYIGPAGK
jgi:hypothetical protein